MKTKSKRFLNLATLCLALLGTTLLMEQPVKADGSRSLSKEQVTERRQFGTYDEGYEQDRKEGYEQGYEQGRKEGATENPEENENVRKNKRYNPTNGRSPYDGYSDGYDSGYSKGYHETANSHNAESQSGGGTQDKVRESTDDSDNEEPQDNHETSTEGKNSTDGSTVSSLLSEIVGIFLDFVLYWF
ncbi:TPA: hypothetical protein ACJ682_000572 [Streptococcus pyogenes]